MYYPRQEFDEQADFLATKMLSQPAWALRIIGRVERWSRLFMEQSKKIRRQPLKKLTNQQLIQLYKSGEKYQVLSQWHRGIGQLARGRGKGARDQGDLAGASGASAKKREQLEYGGYFQCPDHSA